MRRMLIFVAGLLAGSSLGAGISLLFSPKSGDEVRESIKDRFDRAKKESEIAAEVKEEELREEYRMLIHSPNGHQNGNGHHNGNGKK